MQTYYCFGHLLEWTRSIVGMQFLVPESMSESYSQQQYSAMGFFFFNSYF